MSSITLDHKDFQCLQDQLVELRTKNYELADKNRRSQADFEAAKAKICTLQLKLEEQERDFALTSTTLRREIEAVTSNTIDPNLDKSNSSCKDDDYKSKYKRVLHKAKELQQRYESSVEVVEQLENDNKVLSDKVCELEEQNVELLRQTSELQERLDKFQKEYETRLADDLDKCKLAICDEKDEHLKKLTAITSERDSLAIDVARLKEEVGKFDQRLEREAEERKIQDRKGQHIVRELKRQLALEKNRSETLQKRLENVLAQQVSQSQNPLPSNDIESPERLSNGSTNGNSSNENNSKSANQDANSVGSWSIVPKRQTNKLSKDDTSSLCSMNSEGRETVQQPSRDAKSDTDSNSIAVGESESGPRLNLPTIDTHQKLSAYISSREENASSYSPAASPNALSFNFASNSNQAILVEEQAALMERITRLQHEKWTLEEKLSYMEQSNSTLAQDLAQKSEIIRHYFMDIKYKPITCNTNSIGLSSDFSPASPNSTKADGNVFSTRKMSFPNTAMNQLLSEGSGLKRVVEFLKDKSHNVHLGDATSETSINREATRKMQIMLEETLTKCLKLQENLDQVTAELNRLKS